jgi:ketosteroid isomerase-like protein
MTFRETLERHLRAIQTRDLEALADTLPADRLTLVMSDGRLVQKPSEFLDLHRDWFQSKTWSLGVEQVAATEDADLGCAVLRLDYRDESPSAEPVHETSYLTLVFQRQGDRWVMVHDQNTPIKKPR